MRKRSLLSEQAWYILQNQGAERKTYFNTCLTWFQTMYTNA